MHVEKQTGSYLTHEDVATGDFVTFKNEGQIVEKEFQGKKTEKLEISVELPNGKIKTATLNATSHNNMIEKYGDDTADWMGKQARIEVIRQIVGKESKKVVFFTAPEKDYDGNIIHA